MKRFILITIIACQLFLTANAGAGWFGNQTEEEWRIDLQQQLSQQQQSTGGWQVVAGILAVGCIALLVVGAAVGSKARREVKEHVKKR